ncbi:MAG: alpha/beta hydrolase [Leptospiraceae bacterium]|nr:alpha/beta hydrolase [Leptospiraceae bacterium]
MRHLIVRILLFAMPGLALLAPCGCRQTAPQVLFYQPEGTRQIVYATQPERLHITVYPRPEAAARGAVIFIHGGGWQAGGSALPIYSDWHYPLQEAGLRAFSIEHRTAPRYRGQQLLDDCLTAIRTIHQRAAEFGFPADEIALVGYSSGGHLAVLSALELSRAHSIPIKSVVAYYAPLDPANLVYYKDNRLMELFRNYVPEINDDDPRLDSGQRGLNPMDRFIQSLRYYAPIEKIHPAMPPMLLIHGKDDNLVPFSQSVNFAMQADRIVPGRVQLRLIEKADHNFIRSRGRWARLIDQEALLFLLQHMSK